MKGGSSRGHMPAIYWTVLRADWLHYHCNFGQTVMFAISSYPCLDLCAPGAK